MSHNSNRDDREEYLRAWRAKMVQIWQDRLDLMGIHHTGALRRSVKAGAASIAGREAVMAFNYLEYGIYVDLGVGNGYRPGNGGDLHFLGKAYRKLHNLGEPRKRRPWFNKSWYISIEVLKDHMARIMGDEFSGAFDTLTERERG